MTWINENYLKFDEWISKAKTFKEEMKRQNLLDVVD